jgi:hypothetical protein
MHWQGNLAVLPSVTVLTVNVTGASQKIDLYTQCVGQAAMFLSIPTTFLVESSLPEAYRQNIV